jgi:hypothetical protein
MTFLIKLNTLKKTFLLILSLLFAISSIAQKSAEDFGYRHLKLEYEKDTVHILVKSKKGEELNKKPIIFEVQGSTAVPLIVYDGERQVSYVSICEGFVENEYHLVLVSKPGLPLIAHKNELTKGKYKEPNTNSYPEKYLENNNLEYYVKRNNTVFNFLKKQKWVDTTKVVAIGHSEGSTIVAHMANKIDGITHLIYSGGTPYYSRILAMVQQDRRRELQEDTEFAQDVYDYWEDVIKYPFAFDRNKGWNTNYGSFSFSQNENDILKQLKIPILMSYGTLDEGAPFVDMFHIETMKDRHTNFTFKAYVGLDHYYKNVNPNSKNLNEDSLSKVVNDWLHWIKIN